MYTLYQFLFHPMGSSLPSEAKLLKREEHDRPSLSLWELRMVMCSWFHSLNTHLRSLLQKGLP